MCHICQIFGCILRSSLPTASSLTHEKKVQVVLLGSKSKEGENDDNLNPNTCHIVKRYNSVGSKITYAPISQNSFPRSSLRVRTNITNTRTDGGISPHPHASSFLSAGKSFLSIIPWSISFARTSLTLHAPHIPFLITIDILDREKQQGASCSCCVGGGLSNANVRRNNLTALLDDDPQHQQRRILRNGACRCLLLYS